MIKLVLSDEEVVRIVTAFIDEKFPKTCPSCDRVYDSLADYLQSTIHVGNPVSYDAELADWEPSKPLGTFSLANCQCGTTLSIGTQGMKLRTMWRLLLWARVETQRQGICSQELLASLRRKIDEYVFCREAS